MTDRPGGGKSPKMAEQLRQEPAATAAGADFRRLYDQNHGFVWRTLLHFGLTPTQADDALQEVFVVVHKRLDDFDPDRDLRSWLFGIARRVAQHAHRGEARLRQRHAAAPEPNPVVGPEQSAEGREAIGLVERFLSELPEEQRQVFVLAEIEELSAVQVAEMLEVKLNTVYSRLRLARERFQRFVTRQRPTSREAS